MFIDNEHSNIMNMRSIEKGMMMPEDISLKMDRATKEMIKYMRNAETLNMHVAYNGLGMLALRDFSTNFKNRTNDKIY